MTYTFITTPKLIVNNKLRIFFSKFIETKIYDPNNKSQFKKKCILTHNDSSYRRGRREVVEPYGGGEEFPSDPLDMEDNT